MTQYLLRCCNVVTRNPSIPCIKCGELNPYAEEVDKKDRVILLPAGLSNFSRDALSEDRPWGSFSVLLDVRGVKVKRLVVKPGQQLSLQLHRHRDEHWYVVAGEGELTLGSVTTPINTYDAIDIKRYTAHSIKCVSKTDLVFVEIQTGTCMEQDIIRLEDDYGRA